MESFKPTLNGTRFASSGTCFIVRNGDRYFLMSEVGDLIIARLSAEEIDHYREHLPWCEAEEKEKTKRGGPKAADPPTRPCKRRMKK